jgi:flavin-dependent dehydrogenase
VSDCDVIIIGGGPAGATCAALLLRYRPETRVVVIERDQFPRFHVGETLVSEINRVLAESGAYPKVDAAGFVRKYGATFKWGTGDARWDFLFGEMEPLRPAEERHGPVQTTYTWHVDRARFDQILLEHAASLGADVRHGENVVDLLKEGERVVGVRLQTGQELRARWVVDATGQAGLLGSIRERNYDPFLKNIAFWGYWKGADLIDEYCGGETSRAFICAHKVGWTWLFPIRPGVVSVGVVTSVPRWKESEAGGVEDFYRDALATSPELSEILRDAEMVRYEDDGPMLYRITDYSYLSGSISQPGLLRTGDAAGFVDPILSVGCFLGLTSARHLAYAINTLLDPQNKLAEEQVFSSYQAQVSDTILAFRELTYFFYRYNERPDAWWQHARNLVSHAGLPRRATDKQAFLMFATGFAARRSVYREPTRAFDEPFFLDAFRRLVDPSGPAEVPETHLAHDAVVALRGAPTLQPAAVPHDGHGRMMPALRVEFPPDPDYPGERLIRRIHVPVSMGPLFELIDGARTVEQLGDALFQRLGVAEEHRRSVRSYSRQVLEELVSRGLAA